MDPTLVQVIATSWALSAKAQSDAHVGLLAREGDMTHLDHRMLTGALVNGLFASELPGQVSGLNTASHVPTSQPFITPNFVQPTGKPVGA